jgi:hypothetical protein
VVSLPMPATVQVGIKLQLRKLRRERLKNAPDAPMPYGRERYRRHRERRRQYHANIGRGRRAPN